MAAHPKRMVIQPAIRATPGLVSWPEAKAHLTLYQPALDEGLGKLAVFTLPKATTFVSRNTDEITDYAVRQSSAGDDVYLHFHLHNLPDGEIPRRGSIQTVTAAIGLGSDVDCVGPGRKKPAHTVCGSLNDATWIAERLIERLKPIQFSKVIASGYGMCPLLLFKEPWVIGTDDDRKRLADLGRRLHAALHRIACERGWTGAVDLVDLAKVLRFPGMVNWKDREHPKPVKVMWETDARFDPSELAEMLPEARVERIVTVKGVETENPVTQIGDIVVDPAVEVPPIFLAALRETHPNFGPTWDNNRPDLSDQSCSGYDMALADVGVACGLTDQQTADLLIVHRREFPRKKQNRRGKQLEDYLRRTIAKARSGKQSSAAAEKEWEAFDAQLNAAYAEQAEGGTDERPVAAHEPDHAAGDALVFSHNADATDVEAMPPMAVASPANPDSQTPSLVALALNPKANPPFEKFDDLCSRDPKFRLAWEHGRKDVTDQNQAAYDQVLANAAALQGWTDQEIVNLILANRRKHGGDLGLDDTYFLRVMAAAREHAEPAALDEQLTKLLDSAGGGQGPAPKDGRARQNASSGASPGVGGQPDSGKHATILKVLAARLKVPIKRIIKFTGEPGVYRLETELGEVNLGGVAGLINQSKLRVTVADATGRYIPLVDPEKWPPIAQALLDACELVDRGTDATLRGAMGEWLRAYLAEKSIHASLEQADEGREPFWQDGAVIIFAGDFKRWLQIRHNERMTQGRLTADLRAFGAEPGVFKLAGNGRPTTRSAWRLPNGPWIPVTG